MNGEVVVADEIARAIKCVMESDNEVRKKVKEKSEKSRLAVMEGGSSYAALGDLIDGLCSVDFNSHHKGNGGFGALGHSVYHRELFPRLVEGSWNGKIRHIATSGTHTAAITESGLRRDRAKALAWFSKVADRGEPQSMEFLGEIYAGGAGVERNYTKALEWLTLLDSSFIRRIMEWGICMSRAMKWKRKITPQKKSTLGRRLIMKRLVGIITLELMYLKGIGVKRDVKLACKYFSVVANAAHQKAFYQLAKMFHIGVGLK
ncbi:hypothetical protein Pint_36508 [Pistacia integerrima]|uniref:Uncharacterized protein n=1 Tax=Pistacia integerrima TaxID=434235 RepID=A0ACC0Y1A6_9ROSI|nr:hypothetical protein Pint_36508 [Pistacia integerrima]